MAFDSASPTTASVFPMRTRHASSSGSTRWIARAPRNATRSTWVGARASACRSSGTSPRPTVGGSASSRRRASVRPSGSRFRASGGDGLALAELRLCLRLLLRRLDGCHDGEIDLDLDVLANEKAAGLERDVPGQADVLAVDLRAGAERGTLPALHVRNDPAEVGIQHDRTGNAANRQLALQLARVVGPPHD